ncbi:MAG: ribosome biogenesis GTPase YlqF [Oscillospiraceae bacterium]|nr:ribosome biogenesis GTPase YlqF [Oscillospiraceae bacterium]
MVIQWFPGHMSKTRRLISENIKLVDVVIELVDARLPLSSRNPDIDKIAESKPRIVILNKADIADDKANQQWIEYFASLGIYAMTADSTTGAGFSRLQALLDKSLADKRARDREKGMLPRAARAMVVGIPNVGKSSFINKLAGKHAAKTGDRPGITTTKQWIKLAGKYELLDTPGVLWPKFEDKDVALRIAFTGGIKDEILDIEELCCHLLEFLRDHYLANLCERYKLDETAAKALKGYELLELIGRKRGCIVSGGEIDTFRASSLILDDFRSAKIGKITLETPNEYSEER